MLPARFALVLLGACAARRGRAGGAPLVAMLASFAGAGAGLGIAVVVAATPLLVEIALGPGPAE